MAATRTEIDELKGEAVVVTQAAEEIERLVLGAGILRIRD
jgi:hypothetical protein